jgi:hypothetical protein
LREKGNSVKPLSFKSGFLLPTILIYCGGVPAGKNIDPAWDKSIDDGNCEWYFKALFADGEESEPATFDFCEQELELVFD